MTVADPKDIELTDEDLPGGGAYACMLMNVAGLASWEAGGGAWRR